MSLSKRSWARSHLGDNLHKAARSRRGEPISIDLLIAVPWPDDFWGWIVVLVNLTHFTLL
jgi:hypothetical protein